MFIVLLIRNWVVEVLVTVIVCDLMKNNIQNYQNISKFIGNIYTNKHLFRYLYKEI